MGVPIFVHCKACGKRRERDSLGHLKKCLYCRFWSKVTVSHNDECWNWTASKDHRGYGCFSFEGKRQFAHRVAYLLSFESLDPHKGVLHSCDNPACCNPQHLRLGTQLDNCADMKSRGRSLVGERQRVAKLKAQDIPKIFALHREGHGPTAIARMYNVHHPNIVRILQRKIWKHVEIPEFTK